MAKKIQEPVKGDDIKISGGMFQTPDGSRFNTYKKAMNYLTEQKKKQVLINNNSKDE